MSALPETTKTSLALPITNSVPISIIGESVVDAERHQTSRHKKYQNYETFVKSS